MFLSEYNCFDSDSLVEFTCRIHDTASFSDSGEFRLSPGLNVFVGINNSGKSALLWALFGLHTTFQANDQVPHIFKTMMAGYAKGRVAPAIEVESPMPRDEAFLAAYWQEDSSQVPHELTERVGIRWAWTNDRFGFTKIWLRGREKDRAIELIPKQAPPSNTLKMYKPKANAPVQVANKNLRIVPFGASRTESVWGFDWSQEADRISGFDIRTLWDKFFSRALLLSAHRNPTVSMKKKHQEVLDPLGSNLVQVLATLSLSTDKFPDGPDIVGDINKYLRAIFPEIRNVRTESIPHPNQDSIDMVELKLNLTQGGSVSLSHSGTGVQQILCLLTGALMNQKPTLFLLDEPHAYLHPAAERGLVRILEEISASKGHIFCISTHSPVLTSHARKKTFGVIREPGHNSEVVEFRTVETIMRTLGIQNLDLFTYDKILFVEGPSDESVIREAVFKLDREGNLDRVKIVRLWGDGVIKARNRAEFLRVLIEANASEAKVPIGFLLDSNDWESSDRKRLGELKQATIRFFRKPELENYLLHAASVQAALAEKLRLAGAAAPSFSSEDFHPLNAEEKGSQLLGRFYAKHGCEFDKVPDGLAIARQILSNEPEYLQELYDEVRSVFVPERG